MFGGDAFKGLDTAIGCMLLALVVSVPLGVWKLVELVVWVFKHLSWEDAP